MKRSLFLPVESLSLATVVKAVKQSFELSNFVEHIDCFLGQTFFLASFGNCGGFK